MPNIAQSIQSLHDAKDKAEFFPTGLPEVDKALDGGFMRRELVVLGAGTGIGKSYLAGQILWHQAQQGFSCVYFSLEINHQMITSRLVGGEANIKPIRLLHDYLSPEEQQLRDVAEDKLSAHSELITLYDDVYKLEEIEAKIAQGGYDFVVIDFIQNLGLRGEEYDRMSLASLRLQHLAKRTNCCILVLSQLSNSAVDSGRVEYKGSGGIAMVADLGFFLSRVKDEPTTMILELRKNRRGVSGLSFDLHFTTPGGKIL